MLENRSFDHMLGWLDDPPDGFESLRENGYFNVDRNHERVYASTGDQRSGPTPAHSHEGAMVQIGEWEGVPSCGGFVKCEEDHTHGDGSQVMQGLDPAEHCPVLSTLAREFVVFANWHASVPGETWPNRNFAHAATSDGSVDIEKGFYYDKTIFETLTRRKKDWRVYYDGPPQLWAFRRLWLGPTLLDFLLKRKPKIGNWYPMASFAGDVKASHLPAYTFIEPAHFHIPHYVPTTNSQHPNNNKTDPGDFIRGEKLIRDVYTALAANEELFATTALLITYDEHGGWYDHVSPPRAKAPGDPLQRDLLRRFLVWWRRLRRSLKHLPEPPPFDFRRLGVRVPAVLVSPWVAPRVVNDGEPFDHSCIPATLRALHGGRPLTKRDKAARTFHHYVTDSPFAQPRGTDPSPDSPLPPLPAFAEVAEPDPPDVFEAVHLGDAGSEDGLPFLRLSEEVERKLNRTPTALRDRLRARRDGLRVDTLLGPAPRAEAARATAMFDAKAQRHQAKRPEDVPA